MIDRVNSLNERHEQMPDYSTVQGSTMMTQVQPGSLGALTNWKIVMPLEFKMHVLTMALIEEERKSGTN